ncbi:GNAT family N-acetyltransferase [Winogradskyella wichelsiae]|uniref:GNAT family N-acetyltransferase n=1 Tax=Winogradskyella wichelsiae TaxID=2697007 RepID=UPI0015CCA06E|nr:GNAT family N-acetyltransferase [Winogradskyella wichelsiae]
MEQPRLAVVQDMPRVLELIHELATFEKEADAVEITLSDLEQDGFGIDPKFTCFVVEVENNVEGIALVYPRYSTWKGVILHLEDLIVSEKCRGNGLGTLLLNSVVKQAKKLGVKRVSWDVLDWNEPAIKFYESKGADVKRDWDVVHLDENGIKNYLDQL